MQVKRSMQVSTASIFTKSILRQSFPPNAPNLKGVNKRVVTDITSSQQELGTRHIAIQVITVPNLDPRATYPR
jgi:hypothetical protein